MNTLFRARLSSLQDMETETFSTQMFEENTSWTRSEQDYKSKSIHSYRRSNSTSGSYIVDYGPIRVRHRRSTSQTLATGRRSMNEQVYGEEAIRRELRRTRNRIAARKLKQTRDQIEFNLIQKIEDLEQEKHSLQDQHKNLEERRAQLSRAVYNAKQAPLIPLITDINIPLFFGPQQQQQPDLLIDLQPLLKTIDEQFSLSNG